jgi:hypothetical protein
MKPAGRGHHELWASAAAFGTLWGAMEVTLGAFLHALRIPLIGALLAATAAALLVAQRQISPRRGLSLATALVAALLKGFSPAGAILGPMAAILVEGLLVEIALLPAPRARLCAVLAGALAVSWSLTQALATQVLIYGHDILTVYVQIVERSAAGLGLDPRPAWGMVASLAGALLALGALAANYGRRVGRRILDGEVP